MTTTYSNWCIPLDKKIRLKELILFGILGALTFAMKFVMAGLPNIEPVSLSIMVYAAVFGLKALYPTYVYVAMEILYFGLGTWNICYLYIWAILAVAAILMRNMRSSLGWAVLSGAYGLAFGGLCGIVDIFIGGFGYAVSKWVSGIPFDISHCVGNFCIALVLFRPLRELIEKLWKRMQ